MKNKIVWLLEESCFEIPQFTMGWFIFVGSYIFFILQCMSIYVRGGIRGL